MAARMQMVLRYPQIFRKAMEAMNATHDDLTELIFLRLRRNHGTSTPRVPHTTDPGSAR